MADREKVIYDIERCICHVPDACRDCSHYVRGIVCMEELLSDALTLLKSQEAVEPQRAPFPDASRSDGSWYYICGTCSKPIDPKDMYCRHCGKQVKWE